MTLLRKDAPGSAPGGFTWEGPDDVVDVPPALAHELLHQPDGGFHEVFDTPGPTDAEREAAEAAAREAAEAQAKADAEAKAEQEAAEAAAKAAAEADNDEHDEETLPHKKADLVTLAAELGLDTAGTAKEIAARIVAHRDAEKTPVTEPDPDAHH